MPRTGGAGWVTGWIAGVAAAFLVGAFSSGATLLVVGLVVLAFVVGLLDDHGRIAAALKGGASLLLLAVFLRASLGWVDFDLWRPASFLLDSPEGHEAIGRFAHARALVSSHGTETLRFFLALGVAGALHLAIQIFDNLDGVVGAIALVGGGHLALGAGGSELSLLALLGASASLGFLGWNHPPARAFLGNAGSQALGLLTAGLVGAVLLRTESPRSGVLLLLPFTWPLLDLGFVVARRLLAGRRPWVGGRDHTTHALARRIGDRATFAAVLILSGTLALLVRLLPPAV